MRYIHYLFGLVIVLSNTIAFAAEDPIQMGARVFYERCVLCHGTSGMGEGLLPLRLEKYPNTNLVGGDEKPDRQKILKAIAIGGSDDTMSDYMPPMGNELTYTELNAVTDFVMILKTEPNKASKMLKQEAETGKPSTRLGQHLYITRCALCHGKFGEGDGRLSKVIKDPPPANLVKSTVPDTYLEKIIELGGEKMGRSPQMPPWGDQMHPFEIKSLVIYLQSIRSK